MRRYLILAALPALLSLHAHAAGEASAPARAVVPPPPAISDDAAAQAEPEVRILQKGEEKIEEYRLNGKLYMIKVTPAIGAPYYLMDDEGNGQMKKIDQNQRRMIPQWVLIRF
ncbi:DUF2782 domain-containing protein [Paludibacterium paludis]|uniref:DUF2782 domain-containing protein n=1 Tax=Paludibacterium paludis TaxID=1225769 RepID=A0A918P303_9NEIS|nr:DUF2782 domain-containing protein [Paludibacterium paludis]GGY16826.1 hypothetical protein GCM10011289_20330 [Paludibacterium paludis]